jgi:hypothetical protein
MSTFLGTLENTGSRNVDMSVVRYWGGDANGVCLQLTATTEEGDAGYVQLNPSDIVALIPVFKQILDYTFEAKKIEAEEAIRDNKELLKTIINDMREVSEMAINQPVFDYAALMTIGKKELTGGDE